MIADIFTKILASKKLAPISSIEMIKNIISFTYVENKGIAFGMFQGGRVIFILVSIIVLALLLLTLKKTPKEKRTFFLKSGVAFTVSGALGNLIDRIVYGYVVDFIEVTFIDFPVFNIADIAVCVGAAFLVIHFLFFESKNNERKESLDE